MEKLGNTAKFKTRQDIVLAGFDRVSAGGFTQVPNCVLRDSKLSSNAKLVYAQLLSYAWHSNYAFPGQDTMAEDLGLGLRTVSGAVAELQRQGYLEVQRRGLGRTNQYVLHQTVKHKVKK